jgi:hypothetical protein
MRKVVNLVTGEVTEEEDAPVTPLIPTEPSLLDYDIAIERHLDEEAKAAGYYDPLERIPSIDRACSYAGFTNDYQTESQSFVAWRASVWSHVYNVKSAVEAGNRTQPTIEELIAELPQRT